MKGDSTVIHHLQQLLAGELTAVDQYFAHSRLYQDWGYRQLYEHTKHEMGEEQEHADALIQRILFLEGSPDLSQRTPLHVGHDVPSMLRADLDLELTVINHLREVMAYCESVQDYVTRGILQKMLDDTERDHTWWLETQLRLIDQIGLGNYLQSQMS